MFFMKRLPGNNKCRHDIYDQTEVFEILKTTFPSFGYMGTIKPIYFDLLESAAEINKHFRRRLC